MNAKANNTIDKVRELQRGLYQCAKNNRQRRFHALYDKVHRMDVLWKAWDIVRKNKGAGGVDEMTIGEIEDAGVEVFLLEISEALEGGDYRPRPVKRTYIPMKDGKKRPLGLPTVKDKVVQTAAKIVMEPIFEADFRDCSFGFRPKRNQHQALEVIRKKCNNKGWWVLDADIKGYFDNIDHEKLMKLVEKRICDRRMTKLVRLWLKAGVMEDGHVIETETGSAQGASISPLLSNIYLNVLDCYWEKNYSHLGTLVRFADDFVIIAKTKKDIGHAYKAVAYVMAKLGLQLNLEKTRFVNMYDGKDGFDFLGFHHRRSQMETRKGRRYTTTAQVPSKKAKKAMREKIKEVFQSRSSLLLEVQEVVRILNPKIVGLRNYYGLKHAKKALNTLDWYVTKRLILWYNMKHQKKRRLGGYRKIVHLLDSAGLKKLAV